MSRFFSRGILLLAISLAGVLVPARILPAQELAIDDFEGKELVNWDTGANDQHFQLFLNQDPRYVKVGKQSLKVECRYPNRQHTQLFRYLYQDPERKSRLKLSPEADTLSFWMYVESGAGNMTMILGGETGGDLRAPGFQIFPSGKWQRIIVRPDQWPGGAAKAKELWDSRTYFGPVIHGQVTFYLDDLKFIAAKDLPKELITESISTIRAARVYVKDPADVLEGKSYVVPGLRVPKSFSVDHTFPRPAGSLYPSRDKGMPVDLFVELPAEIQAAAVMVNTMDPCDVKANPILGQVAVLAEKKAVVRDGRPLIQYRWELPYVKGGENSLPVFFETTLAPGQERVGYYYLAWKDGGAQPPQPMTFVSVDIPPVPRLKKFIVGVWGLEADMASRYFPNFPEDFMRLGFNTIAVYGQHWGEPIPPEVEKARAAGLFLRWGDAFWPRRPDGWHGPLDWGQDADARGVGIDGKPVNVHGNPALYVLCPSYRGKLFEESVNQVLKSGMIEKYGITWFNYDLEIPEQNKICFCDRCLAGWEKFRTENYPKLPATSPKDFMRDPVKNDDQHTAWIDYRCYQWADLFEEMKRRWAPALEKVKAGGAPWTNPWPGRIVFGDWSWGGAVFTRESADEQLKNRRWAEAVDIAEVGLYSTIDSTARILHGFFATDVTAGYTGKKRLLGNPSFGQCYPTDDNNPPKWLKYTVLESAAAGTLGVYVFSVTTMDGIKLKYLADGLRIIQPVEDLIIEGQANHLITAGHLGFARGVERGEEALIAVSAYDMAEGKEVSVGVRYPVKSTRKVIDLETRQEVGVITPEYPQFGVKLKEDRVRLFYVGNKLEGMKQ